MRLDRYVFGSVHGYGQLARSPGISDADAQAFDAVGLGFGQTNASSFTNSLAETPAFFTQAVRGGRWAIIRVLQGRPDDVGRPTLILFWLVLDRKDWETQLGGNPQTLLETTDLWRYDGQPTLPTLQITLPAPQPAASALPERLQSLLNDVRRNIANGRSTIVSASDYTSADLSAVTAAAPLELKASMTIAYRSINARLPVTLNAVAEEAHSGAVSSPRAGSAVAVVSEAQPTMFETNPQVLKDPNRPAGQPSARAAVATYTASATTSPLLIILAALALGGPIISYIVAHNQARQQIIDLQQRIDPELADHTKQIDELQQRVQAQLDMIRQQGQKSDQINGDSTDKYKKVTTTQEKTDTRVDKLEKQLDDWEAESHQKKVAENKDAPVSKNDKPTSQPTTQPAAGKGNP